MSRNHVASSSHPYSVRGFSRYAALLELGLYGLWLVCVPTQAIVSYQVVR